MKRSLILALLVPFFSCGLLGGGGGGGGGEFTFTRGFVFVRKSDNNLYAANQSAMYTDVFRLTETGGIRQPSLSKNGTNVVFVRKTASATEILTVPSSGGTAKLVMSSTGTMSNLRTPVFSPDGMQIAFAFDTGASSAIGLINVDGSGLTTLIGGGTLSYASPSFSADGLSIFAMTGNSSSAYTQLERVNVATKQSLTVSSNLGVGAVNGITNRAVVSPDGASITFDGKGSTGASRVFVLDVATQLVHQVTDYPSEPTAQDSFPAWVASDRVSFVSDSGGEEQVYVLNASSIRTSGGLTMPSASEAWFGPN